MATEKFAQVSEHNRVQNMKLAATKAFSVPRFNYWSQCRCHFWWLALSPIFWAEPVPVPLWPLSPPPL